jgi:hypothetical protein
LPAMGSIQVRRHARFSHGQSGADVMPLTLAEIFHEGGRCGCGARSIAERYRAQ